MRAAANVLSVAWMILVLAAAGFAPRLAPFRPSQIAGDPLLAPTDWRPMGTDDLGRDEWSRMVFGGRLSLAGSLAAATLAVGVGTLAAILAVGLGGVADTTVSGGSSAALAIPSLLLALLVVAALGPGLDTLVVAVGLALAPGYARLARSALRKERNRLYVAAASALGSGRMDTVRRHMVPNAIPALLSLATTHYAWAFGGLTTLTFLGLAGDISQPEWGAMLNGARQSLRVAPWLALFPGAAIAGTILSVHHLGAWLARRSGSTPPGTL